MPGEAAFVLFVAALLDATLARLIRPTTPARTETVGRIRRSRRIRHSVPDATLTRLIRPTVPSTDRRTDKAFYAASGNHCRNRKQQLTPPVKAFSFFRCDKTDASLPPPADGATAQSSLQTPARLRLFAPPAASPAPVALSAQCPAHN